MSKLLELYSFFLDFFDFLDWGAFFGLEAKNHFYNPSHNPSQQSYYNPSVLADSLDTD